MKFLTVCFLSLNLLFAACNSKKEVQEGEIRIALESSPKTLDPRRATDANGQRLVGLIFQSFVKLGPEMEIIGDAASSWDLSKEALELRLQPMLKFSNGKNLTKEDILFSFAEYKKDGSIFASSFKTIGKIEISENNEKGFLVKVDLNDPTATLLTDLSLLKILPKSQVEKYGEDFSKHVIGTGPYALEKQTSNEIVLVKNSHYTKEVKNKKLSFKVIKDDNTRYLKILKGNIDLAPNVLSPQSSIKLLKNDKFNHFRAPGLAMNYLLVNLKDPLLKKKETRTAIAHAIDKNSIIQYKLEGLASPASSILTPSNPFFDSKLNLPAFSLEAAKTKIKNMLTDKKTLSIKTSNNPNAVENAKILANQISKLGFDVKIESYEWGTFFEDIKNGNYQLATMRWVGATDPDIYRVAFHSNELPPSGRNRGHYQNKELDKLLDSGIGILSMEDRIKHYQKVQEIIAEDLPIIPLWYNEQINIVSKEIEGFKTSKTGDFSYFINLVRKKN
ncbi:MAG: ABC transporter substrate-binding protein [Bdellovibrionota bacterium]|nr:ABC transporter substrate-binding protein [Bdellovibrionota bacterium]